MASNFWDGFSQSFFQQSQNAIQNERLRARDARDAERFEWERGQQKEKQEISEGYKQLAADQQYGMVDAGANNAGDFARFDRSGGAMPTPNARQQLAPIDYEKRLLGLNTRRQDSAGMRAGQDRIRTLQEDDAFARGMQGWDDPKQRDALVRSVNSGHPNMTLVQGKDGYTRMVVVDDKGGASEKSLSDTQLKALAGATALMDINPKRALEIIAKIDADLAASTAKMLETQMNAAKTNNAAQHYANSDANDLARTNAYREGQRNQGAALNRANYQIIGPTEDGRGLLGFDQRSGKLVPVPLPEGANAADVFRKISGQPGPKQFDPREYAATYKDLVLSGMAPPEARKQTDIMFGQENPDTVMIDKLKAENEARLKAAGGGPAGQGLKRPAPVSRTPEQQKYYDETAAIDEEAAVGRQRERSITDGARQITPNVVRGMSPETAAQTLRAYGPALGLQQRSALQQRAQGR